MEVENRMRRAAAGFLVAALLGICAPLPAGAQLRGVVVSDDDQPLEGVVVEAWGERGWIASAVTDAAGAFDFPPEVGETVTELRAGRMSFRSARVRVRPGNSSYVLRMDEDPILLPSLVVETARDFCAGRSDEAAARELWEAVRARYAGVMDTLGVATYTATAERIVAPDSIGLMATPEEVTGQRSSASLLRFSWTRRARRSGYAFPTWRVVEESSFRSWVYAPLEADFAPHFVDQAFGDLHALFLLESGPDEILIGFCPFEDDHPAIEGRLEIRPDTTLAGAAWVFRTPEPVEHAGGRVSFGPASASPERNFPLPTEGLFWRRVASGDFWERHERFLDWKVAAGDSVPFLPQRRGEGG